MAIYVRNKEGVMESYKIVGLKGENGVTPNIQIGTVTTLEPGEKATVVNNGTKENPVFDFGIPKGADGTGGGSSITLESYDLVYENGINTNVSQLHKFGNMVRFYFRIPGGAGIQIWKQFTTIPEGWRPLVSNINFFMYGEDGSAIGGFLVTPQGKVMFSSNKAGYTCMGWGCWMC